jgi:hypothetical protein
VQKTKEALSRQNSFIWVTYTTGFEVFTESEIPLGEGPFPLTEAFTESLLSVKASRRTLYR